MDSGTYLIVGDLHISERDELGLGARTVRALGHLLDEKAKDAAPPTVVFNGDFVDLDLGRPGAALHRLSALARLRAVLDRHPEIVPIFARYIAAGGRFVILHGNHDMEWCRDRTRAEFLSRLQAVAGPVPADAVVFHDGPLHRPGLFYIDHGHQFDPDNRIEYRTVTVDSPAGGPVPVPPLGVLVSRHILSAIHSDAFFDDDGKTPLALFFKALSHGPVAGVRTVASFYRAAAFIFAASVSRRLRGEDRPSAETDAAPESAFWARSTMNHPLRVFRRMYLDRSLMTLAFLVTFLSILLALPLSPWLRVAFCAVFTYVTFRAVSVLPNRYGTRSATLLREGARRIAERLGARFVLFGHVHDEFVNESGYLNPGRFLRRHEGGYAIHFAGIEVGPDGCVAGLHRWALDPAASEK